VDSAEVVFVGVPGTALDAASAALLRGGQPGGVILFKRNVESAEQLRRLVGEIRRCLPGALLAVDAEGGRVDRLREVVGPAPAPCTLAAMPPRAAARAGRWVGRALRLFDLDVDFAPVVDLDRGRQNNALDGRYFGRTARAVAARGAAFLSGLESAGVGGCVKHFPGLGGAGEDTHHRFAVVDLQRGELRLDLAPFARLAPLAGAVMVSHAIYPAYDADERPASLSPRILGGLLRSTLGFSGVVFSDDLEMNALEAWGGLPARCAHALAAGCDLLPVCHSLAALPEIAARLAAPDLRPRLAEARLRLAAYRRQIRALRRGRPAWPGRSPESLAEGVAQVRQAFASLGGEAAA
jgi:beta-N-acetylhexosaminidase